ncbi:hypothetical protein COCSUDRAFT_34592 [Coccomyxa subellipsoidea C-169]|uniref:Uncharacterized protein n=1 Tax=Coccomyxa subellipsoidea (strain C-169) TaxID=574566 RepID=I0YIS5_COCSC|nr:hypothetical protein COCSUDRAFT_34592 [Coccomyxa subellipsoidea C-169]EIE18294.1 hypothetical protein COCSUDRAFT_34592 [Coccomyxa subellipsoidea C-169]|eukprot:XP_005642838.1 hypothetical protein COCSUDRAFT_34592 [Coccomyxa subellipsoidea C-169]
MHPFANDVPHQLLKHSGKQLCHWPTIPWQQKTPTLHGKATRSDGRPVSSLTQIFYFQSFGHTPAIKNLQHKGPGGLDKVQMLIYKMTANYAGVCLKHA